MPERLMMEDAALAEDARNGSAAAFAKLAKRWWTPLYRVSWNYPEAPRARRRSRNELCSRQFTRRSRHLLREFRSKYSSIELPPLSKCSSPQRRE